MDDEPEDFATLEEKMIRAGAFNPDDLMFNQAGTLSPRQKRGLMFEVAGWGFQAGFNLTLLIFAWIFYYFQHGMGQWWWVGGLLWSVLLGMSIFMCIENMRPVWADLKNDDVQSVTGKISKKSGRMPYRRHSISAPNWAILVDGRQFSVIPSIYNAVIAGESYRFFYIPTLNRVINVEPLPFSIKNKE